MAGILDCRRIGLANRRRDRHHRRSQRPSEEIRLGMERKRHHFQRHLGFAAPGAQYGVAAHVGRVHAAQLGDLPDGRYGLDAVLCVRGREYRVRGRAGVRERVWCGQFRSWGE